MVRPLRGRSKRRGVLEVDGLMGERSEIIVFMGEVCLVGEGGDGG